MLSLYLGNVNGYFLFQVVKKAALTTSLLAGVGAALIGLRILKKDLKLFWEDHYFLINSAHFASWYRSIQGVGKQCFGFEFFESHFAWRKYSQLSLRGTFLGLALSDLYLLFFLSPKGILIASISKPGENCI